MVRYDTLDDDLRLFPTGMAEQDWADIALAAGVQQLRNSDAKVAKPKGGDTSEGDTADSVGGRSGPEQTAMAVERPGAAAQWMAGRRSANRVGAAEAGTAVRTMADGVESDEVEDKAVAAVVGGMGQSA